MTGMPPRRDSSARERTRAGTMADLVAAARRQLAETGVDGLSLRSVARELGVVPSAVYRYVQNRDELLALLVLDCYESMSRTAEDADRAAAAAGADAGARWLAVSFAVLEWARRNRHEYSLLYSANPSVAAVRAQSASPMSLPLWRVILGIVDAAIASGGLRPPERPFAFDGLLSPESEAVAGRHGPPFDDAVVRSTALYTSLLGSVASAVSRRLHWIAPDDDRLFALTIATCAEGVGLEMPVPRQGDLWQLQDVLDPLRPPG